MDDAFGSCHRAHCSTAGVTDYIKDTAVGYLMEKEIRYLGNAVNDPVRPFTAILGGAKVADKLNVISNLLEKVDTLIIGGGMAYTFIKAQGYEIGKSLCDDSKIDYCKEMMEKAKAKGVKLLLPVDTACVKDFPDPIDAPVETVVYPIDKMPADMEGCDIGPETMKLFADAVKASKTVVWNGPMGVFENPTLAAGTLAVAKAMAESDATTVIGGGDSAAAVQQMGLGDKMTHISTAAALPWSTWRARRLPRHRGHPERIRTVAFSQPYVMGAARCAAAPFCLQQVARTCQGKDKERPRWIKQSARPSLPATGR